MTFYPTSGSHIVVTASNVLATQSECDLPDSNTLSVSIFNLNHDETLSSPYAFGEHFKIVGSSLTDGDHYEGWSYH